MSEEKPNIINLGERRKEKENKKKRTSLGLTPDGYFIYPEEKVEITVEEAAALADGIIEKYGDSEVRFQDFAERERKQAPSHEYRKLTDAFLRKKLEEDFAFQKRMAELMNSESLLKILGLYKTSPEHYYGILIFSVAEEFKKRVGLKKED